MTTTVNELSYQLPIVLTDDEAAQIAEIMLYRGWTEREQFELSLGMKYAILDAGDVLQVTVDGNIHTMRIVSSDLSLPGLVQIKAVADRASIYTSSVTGGAASYPTQTLVLIGDTLFEVLDLPSLRDSDLATAGYYLAAYGSLSSWTGCLIAKSTDAGTSWTGVATKSATNENTMGTTTDILSDYLPRTWDMTNTVNITVADSGTLASDTSDNVLLNDANRAVIGDEIIGFTTATLEGDGTYTLSGLLRGLQGTEWAISQHAVGDRFVLLESAKLIRVESTYGQMGAQVKFKGVSNGQAIEEVTAVTDVTFDNLNAKPWSVVKIDGSRDGSNNLTITWSRRSRRIAAALWTPVLEEDSEKYLVYIMNGAAIVRIFNPVTETELYTAAEQTSDGFTPGDPITVKIYQVSATVGNGYESEATI